MDDFINNTLLKLTSFLKGKEFPLHVPSFNQKEQDLVLDCIKTGWVSSVGSYVDQLERDLETYTGIKKCVVVMNGTAALHICYMSSGVKENDEVLCPSLTFVATANAIRYCDAIPHFVEIEKDTLGVCPIKLRKYLSEIGRIKNGVLFNKNTDRRISALAITHIFGHPAKLEELKQLCDEYSIALIEDAAEGLGSFYRGIHVGNFGKCAALSFNGNKIITTGGGGAVLTNDEELGIKIKHLTTTAKVGHSWLYVYDQLGYNYRMPNINAALGCAQLSKIEDFILTKRKIADCYLELFREETDAFIMKEPEFCRSNYWLNTLVLNNEDQDTIKCLLEKTHSHKIFTRPLWRPLHLLTHFKDCPRMSLELTEKMEHSLLNLPSSVEILDETC